MPCIVWCSRSPYHSSMDKHEVLDIVARVEHENPKGFFYLDLANHLGEFHGEQTVLNSAYVSSIVNWTPDLPGDKP